MESVTTLLGSCVADKAKENKMDTQPGPAHAQCNIIAEQEARLIILHY